ncbi:MAG: hypothetical protein RJA49_2932 [Actinomycetota bacterium]
MVEALERVLALDPSATAVRSHLARTFFDGGEAARAWPHCLHLVATAPDDREVIELAADVAEALGKHSEAESYRRLLALLSRPAASAVQRSDDAFGEDVDIFIRDVMREHDEQHITLADIGGMDDVKRRIESSFLGPLRNPDLRLAYGKSLRGGLLLWGPPGCGKTHIARAIAGELDATFISVGIHEVLDMWVGSSERNLHGWFELARRERPSVLFFDELDALGHSRTRQVTGAVRNVVATLLTELDGLGADNESIFTLAATNQPWDVDPALRRPGRFDRTVAVMPPDESARAAILAVHLRNRPVGQLDLTRLAKASHGFSGADLRLVCEAAVEFAFGEASASGQLVPVSQSHLLRAVAETKPSVGAWLDHARNYVNYANDDGTYDELADYLKRDRSRR